MAKKRRLKMNKVGEISSQGMQDDLGLLSSTVFLTQVGYGKTKGKKKKGERLFTDKSLVKSANESLDSSIDFLKNLLN